MRAFINELGVEDMKVSIQQVFCMLSVLSSPVGNALDLARLDKMLDHPHYIFRDPTRISEYSLQELLRPGLLDTSGVMFDHLDNFLEYMGKKEPHSRGVVTLIIDKTSDPKGYLLYVSTIKGALFDNLTRKYFINTFIDSM